MSVAIRPTYRSSIGRHIGRHTGGHIGRHIDRCSTNTTRPICRSRCRPTYRSSIGRFVDRHIDRYVGRHVDQHIGRGVRKLHMILSGSFSNATNSFFPERKKSPSLLTLQKVFLPVKLDRSFLFSSCGNAILALKASLVRFTFSRNLVEHKNFSCWIYLSLKGFAWYIFSGVHWETTCFKKTAWIYQSRKKNVTTRKKFSKISWEPEQVSCLSK